MQSLKELIAALQKEVGDAVVDNKSLPHNVRLEAERVVVTLGFTVQKEASQTIAFNFGSDAATNSLSIEFRCETGTGQPTTNLPEPSNVPRGETLRELTDQERDLVTRQLTHVFGTPGFDSSARATVFREAFENLSDSEMEALVETFSATCSTPPSGPVKRSVGLIHRLCEAGPVGRNDAKKILASSSLITRPLRSLISFRPPGKISSTGSVRGV